MTVEISNNPQANTERLPIQIRNVLQVKIFRHLGLQPDKLSSEKLLQIGKKISDVIDTDQIILEEALAGNLDHAAVIASEQLQDKI